MTDLKVSNVYRIYCLDDSVKDEYIGSTCNFNHRKIQHKYNCNNEKSARYNLKLYRVIREYGGWSNWSFDVVETFDYIERPELIVIEREWVDWWQPSLNKQKPGRNKAGWDQDNKDHIAEYRKDNKEKFAVRSSEYRQKNKEKIAEKKKKMEKITCECGAVMCKYSLPKHKKTAKHKKYLENL
jgi:hypothetical protein